jgi:hypothetical protein
MAEEFSILLPLDSGGFLRRQCPTCEREFKWLGSTDEDAPPAAVPDAGYHCPLCGVQAASDAWWTRPQLDLATATAAKEIVGPELENMADKFNRSTGGGIIEISMEVSQPAEPPTLIEPDDMRRVDFACHPADPAKVSEDFSGEVHCRICNAPAG